MSQTYIAKHITIDAAFVSLAGASLAVVSIDGKAHVIPAEAFLALYQEQTELPKPETKRQREEKRQVAKALAPKKVDKLDEMAMRDLDKMRAGEWRMEEKRA